jgi:chemotaxis protein MotB
MNKNREVPLRIVVRKKRHSHVAHGGAWKVAFADFMTAMFALFLVLWLVNQSSDVRAAVAGYFSNPLGLPGEAGSAIMPTDNPEMAGLRPSLLEPISLRQLQLRDLESRLRQRMEDIPELASVSGNIEIQLVDEGLRIQLLEDSAGIFFETGRAEPKLEGREILTLLGSELGSLPNLVIIEGHTDSRQYAAGAKYTNWELSADRANAARRILTSSGLEDSRISQVRGWADRRLRIPEDPLSPTNRRVTVTIRTEWAASSEAYELDAVAGDRGSR